MINISMSCDLNFCGGGGQKTFLVKPTKNGRGVKEHFFGGGEWSTKKISIGGIKRNISNFRGEEIFCFFFNLI